MPGRNIHSGSKDENPQRKLFYGVFVRLGRSSDDGPDNSYSSGRSISFFWSLSGAFVGLVMSVLWLPFALIALPIQTLAQVVRAVHCLIKYGLYCRGVHTLDRLSAQPVERGSVGRFAFKLVVMDLIVFPVFQALKRLFYMPFQSVKAGYQVRFLYYFESGPKKTDPPWKILSSVWSKESCWETERHGNPGKKLSAYSETNFRLPDPLSNPLSNPQVVGIGYQLIAVGLLATLAFGLILTGVFAPAALIPGLGAMSLSLGGFEVGLALIGFGAVAVVGAGVSLGGHFIAKSSDALTKVINDLKSTSCYLSSNYDPPSDPNLFTSETSSLSYDDDDDDDCVLSASVCDK